VESFVKIVKGDFDSVIVSPFVATMPAFVKAVTVRKSLSANDGADALSDEPYEKDSGSKLEAL